MAKITQLSDLDLEQTYTYADYLTWRFDEAVELLRGKILMSPAPNINHQSISRNLLVDIGYYLKNKHCKVFSAPFDVRLYDRKKSLVASQEIYTVVQPDLCVVCDTDKLDSKGCLGAPDWIIEILSKSTAQKDTQTKFQLYQEAGVKEYWLVYPYEATVSQFVLDDAEEKYQLVNMFSRQDRASPLLFPELLIDLQEVFSK
ncbi:MAG: Uma2 family endonuclease [Methylovulum sp.]|uniref:Uma2 family endonuclease n=1 Tax=Methylovulum sp. TaxID=1916980 RepID=UPI00260AB36A|nr:Uma2 family endonuclease [Methylovulum sp.]MDD2724041.1 Uma2 family endonuclease [Methylovulum sp.]MDD5124186.1 Uma2 family endonuclease [Methylovulum sp.]